MEEIEYKSPKYRNRITRIFEINIIEDSIRFENSHCYFFCKIGSKKITDSTCKNIKIKSICTREQFENAEYKLDN